MDEARRTELIRRAYEAYNDGDIEAVLELLDEQVELRPPSSSLDPEPLRGREAVREYLMPNLFGEQSAEPEQIIDEGDRILVVAHARARGRESGATVDQTVFHLLTVAGERVVRFEVHLDREQALAALKGDAG